MYALISAIIDSSAYIYLTQVENYLLNPKEHSYYGLGSLFTNGPDMWSQFGDYFKQANRGNTKKLKKLYNELKLTKNEKENKLIKKAKENYDVLIGAEEVKRLAEIRLMSQLEEQAALETARDKGTRKGMELGKKEGMELGKKEGMELGKKEGLELGKKDEKIEIAKKLKKLKMPIEKISEITGLSEEEIIKI